MVTLTNHGPMSLVFALRNGTSKSLPPGATDDFDLADREADRVERLKADGSIGDGGSKEPKAAPPADVAAAPRSDRTPGETK